MSGSRRLRIVHLSRARDASDGGIAMAVAGLLEAQRGTTGLEAHWLTPASHPAFGEAVGACDPQLLHVHGLWRAPNRLAARLQHRLPLVVAPHGMLDPWAFAQHRRRKTLLWWAYQRRSLQRAAALQALCAAEHQALRRFGLTAPVALIPNGIALPEASAASGLPPPCWTDRIPPGQSVLLFLGRFHHKKGLQALLQAWAALAEEARRAGWSLVLVGHGDRGRLQQQLAASPIPGCHAFAPAFGEAKAALLHAASAFVLPSFSEGLPMAALEAMAHELPCLLSEACNLPEAFSAGAALPAEPDPAALAIALRQLFALSAAECAAMGRAGRALVAERYSWPRVAQQTLELYGWILGGGGRPGFVELG